MSKMTTAIINEGQENEETILKLSYDIAASGKKTVKLDTDGKYFDKDIHVEINTPAAADPTLSLTDLTAEVTMGDATNGYYNPTVSLSGNANIATAGWITSGNHAVSDSSVGIGKIAQSTLKNGNTAIDSGDEIIPDVSQDQTINISAGYNTARTVIVAPMEDGQEAEVSSPNLSIGTADASIDYNSTSSKFDLTASETIDAPSVNTPGFISSTKGTKNSGTASVAVEIDPVTVGVTVTGTAKVTPAIARTAKPSGDTWVDAASGSATTTKPVSGAYVQVDAAAVTSNISSVGKVSAAGYGDTNHYSNDTATSTEVGSNAAASTYVPINAGTVESGTAEINSVTYTYNSTSGKFDIEGSANIPAPSITTEGYVASGVGTLTGATGGATVDVEVNKVEVTASLTGTGTAKPIISKNVATNVDASAATTTQPSSGFYVAVGSAADTATVHATAAVTGAGYGDTTSGHYTAVDSSNLTVGAEASDVTYVPITAGALANAAETGVSYTDLSSSGPVVPSDGYLFIKEGYYANSKISLARLVPDEATLDESTGSASILANESAYDSDGKLIVGTIPTYDGSYTIE